MSDNIFGRDGLAKLLDVVGLERVIKPCSGSKSVVELISNI